MSLAHDVLATRSQEVLLRWRAEVEGKLAPESLPELELVDHLPSFLGEIVAALRGRAGGGAGQAAEEHGQQRLRLGFSIDSVIREYGALRDAIWATLLAAGVEPTRGEQQQLFTSIVDGIARAASEFSRQRDAELHRQHNEHMAFIAHELRNPLMSARMSVTLLKRSGGFPSEARGVDTLERGLQRMQEGIDHTLEVARVASGVTLRRERLGLRPLLEEAALAVRDEAQERMVSLHVAIDEDIELEIDGRLVRSALSNLVRNAVLYSRAGGRVEIRGTSTRAQVTVEIEDCCGGLQPGKVEQAFAPFIRLNDRATGFGLGLAIAKHAVDAHAGTIRVQNLPGKGCIFVLELPRAPA